MTTSIHVGVHSETGRRLSNEDFAASLFGGGSAEGTICALADGLGGARGGRVASELAVRALLEGYASGDGAKEVSSVVSAAQAINRWVFDQGRSDPNLAGMATTLTAVVLTGDQMHVLHVGDTRLYRLRAGRLDLLTRDHRMAGFANALTRAVGAEEFLRIDYLSERLERHDRLLLCSDGLHGVLSDHLIRDSLRERRSPQVTAYELVQTALRAGSDDNVTAIVADVVNLPRASQDGLLQAAADLPVRPAPRVGDTVDGFLLTDVVGDSRFARSFKARRDPGTPACFLLKFPKPDVLGASASARAAFLRECWISSRIQHPSVGSVIAHDLDTRSQLYVLQEFYEGESLERRLSRRPPVGLEEGLRIAVKLAQGMTALHRAGVIHRDIKPENILLQPGGELKILDFGIARISKLDRDPADQAPGTPSYMAPELFDGAPADERSDIFALGVSLYRMFSGGVFPYGEVSGATRPLFRPARLVSTHRPDLPAWIDEVIARAIELDPKRRAQDGYELLYDLENGAASAMPARRPAQPLFERHPLLFWQVATAVLAFLLLIALEHR